MGSHGLPLIGGGDWNDGMNRVGREGRGESVWLGWFLHANLSGSPGSPTADRKRSVQHEWRKAAASLATALDREAWDGEWYSARSSMTGRRSDRLRTTSARSTRSRSPGRSSPALGMRRARAKPWTPLHAGWSVRRTSCCCSSPRRSTRQSGTQDTSRDTHPAFGKTVGSIPMPPSGRSWRLLSLAKGTRASISSTC